MKYYCIILSLSLYTFSLRSAEPAAKKARIEDIEKKAYSHWAQCYCNAIHAHREEVCHSMYLINNKRMLSIGYDPLDARHYARLHSTEDGKDILIADQKEWATMLDEREDSAFCCLMQSLSHSEHKNRRIIALSKSLLIPSCHSLSPHKSPPYDVIDLREIIDLSKSRDLSKRNNFPPVQQSCFLKNYTQLAAYVPSNETILFITMPQNNEQKATCNEYIRNVSAAELSRENIIYGQKNGEVFIRDVATTQPTINLPVFSATQDSAAQLVSGVALSRDYVAVSSEKTIRIFSRSRIQEAIRDGACASYNQYTHAQDDSSPRLLRFSPDNTILAYTASTIIFFLEAVTARVQQKLNIDAIPYAMFFDQDDLFVGASGSIAKYVKKINLFCLQELLS